MSTFSESCYVAVECNCPLEDCSLRPEASFCLEKLAMLYSEMARHRFLGGQTLKAL